MLRPTSNPSKWLPELDNPTAAYALLVLGAFGLVAELTSTRFPGRTGLYIIAIVAGIFGVLRRRRRVAT